MGAAALPQPPDAKPLSANICFSNLYVSVLKVVVGFVWTFGFRQNVESRADAPKLAFVAFIHELISFSDN